MTRRSRRTAPPAALLATLAMLVACVAAPPAAAPPTGAVLGDTAGRALVPAGYGTLRQDDISLHLDGPGVLVRALPLDESVIRLLTPDSYRALRGLRETNAAAIDATVRRYGMRRASVWLVSFYGVQPDARFTPGDVIITSGGRDYRPYDIIPLTGKFGEQRLEQRETESGLFVYDGEIDVEQPVTVSYAGVTDASWQDILQQLERERAVVRARAGQGH